MKKLSYIILIILLVFSLFAFTGCKSKEKKTEEKLELSEIASETLVYYDEKTRDKITFEYFPEEKYKIVKEDTGGAFKSIEFENEDLNITVEMYLIQEYNGSFENSQEANKEANNYREFTVNGYNGYTYSQSNSSSIHSKILILQDLDETEGLSLYMYIDKMNSKKDTDLMETFYSEDFIRFLNTLTYENN